MFSTLASSLRAELRQRLGQTITYKMHVSDVPNNLLSLFPEATVVANLIKLKTPVSDETRFNQLIDVLHSNHITIKNIESQVATLDEVFASLTAE